MWQKGFTLVELLVVMAVMAIVGVVVFVNIETVSQDQVLNKALDDVQSLSRVAQSNATSGLMCYPGRPTLSWIMEFPSSDRRQAHLKCFYSVNCSSFDTSNPQCDMNGDGTIDSTDQDLWISDPTTGYKSVKTITLENATVANFAGTGCLTTGDIFLRFANVSGQLTLPPSSSTSTCSALTVTLTNALDTSRTKSFTINQGGAVNAN